MYPNSALFRLIGPTWAESLRFLDNVWRVGCGRCTGATVLFLDAVSVINPAAIGFDTDVVDVEVGCWEGKEGAKSTQGACFLTVCG